MSSRTVSGVGEMPSGLNMTASSFVWVLPKTLRPSRVIRTGPLMPSIRNSAHQESASITDFGKVRGAGVSYRFRYSAVSVGEH